MTFKSDVALRMKKWISQVFSVGLFIEYVRDIQDFRSVEKPVLYIINRNALIVQ